MNWAPLWKYLEQIWEKKSCKSSIVSSKTWFIKKASFSIRIYLFLGDYIFYTQYNVPHFWRYYWKFFTKYYKYPSQCQHGTRFSILYLERRRIGIYCVPFFHFSYKSYVLLIIFIHIDYSCYKHLLDYNSFILFHFLVCEGGDRVCILFQRYGGSGIRIISRFFSQICWK